MVSTLTRNVRDVVSIPTLGTQYFTFLPPTPTSRHRQQGSSEFMSTGRRKDAEAFVYMTGSEVHKGFILQSFRGRERPQVPLTHSPGASGSLRTLNLVIHTNSKPYYSFNNKFTQIINCQNNNKYASATIFSTHYILNL